MIVEPQGDTDAAPAPSPAGRERRLHSFSLPNLALGLLGVAILVYALWSGGYLVTVIGFGAIYAIFVIGLNIFMGYTGQISFGQNAFAALGGYISAILTTDHGWPPLVALVLAAVASSLLALVVGYPTLRLRGHYLAMATLALGLITYEVAVQWQSLTQGYLGIAGIPPLGIGRWELLDDRLTLLAVLAVVALGLWVSYRLKRSRFGRALGAIAGDEDAARALGVDVTRHKLAAFAVAAAYASISGSMFAHVVQFISPEVFGLHMVVLGFTMLYVGGIGTIFGPLIGAMIISLLPEALRGFKEYQDLVYGIALIVILIFAPKGLSSLTHLSSQLLGIARKRP